MEKTLYSNWGIWRRASYVGFRDGRRSYTIAVTNYIGSHGVGDGCIWQYSLDNYCYPWIRAG